MKEKKDSFAQMEMIHSNLIHVNHKYFCSLLLHCAIFSLFFLKLFVACHTHVCVCRFSFRHLACFISCKYVKRGNIPYNILAQSTTEDNVHKNILFLCVVLNDIKISQPFCVTVQNGRRKKRITGKSVCCHEYVE